MVLPVSTAMGPRSEGDFGGETGGTVNLVPCAPVPTFLYIAGHRGPPTIRGLGAPDQGANRSGSDGPLGPLGGEINLTQTSHIQQTGFSFLS